MGNSPRLKALRAQSHQASGPSIFKSQPQTSWSRSWVKSPLRCLQLCGRGHLTSDPGCSGAKQRYDFLFHQPIGKMK